MSVAYLSSRGIPNNIFLFTVNWKRKALAAWLPHLSTVYIDWSN